MKKRPLKIVLIVLLLLLVLDALVGYGFISYSLDEKSPIARHVAADEFGEENRQEREEFLSSFPSDAHITSFDGLTLHAYEDFTHTGSDVYVILMYGYKSGPFSLKLQAEAYRSKGYNILIPDERAQGESEGRYITMGVYEQRDLLSWIDYVISCDPEARIILHGISMGAATVMLASAEELPDNVIAAVEDCGYTSASEIFAYVLKQQFHLPSFPIINTVELLSRPIAGFDFSLASPIEAVGRTKIPMLFIHGSADDFVPFYMLDILYEASSSPGKQKLVIEGAGHAHAASTDSDLYFSTVDNFISACL